METEKITDLSMVVYQSHPECQDYKDMWKNFGCTEYAWIKEKGLIKHQNCSNIFSKYLDCVIHHSHK